ncbi:amidohydrolase family protein [Amycolatopsis sp. NPDC059027]|uniref:amidohydrolase family protein n=1 Tax=unclassified Amycolatopsis TaxID=2618356 RepID=UPI0036714037
MAALNRRGFIAGVAGTAAVPGIGVVAASGAAAAPSGEEASAGTPVTLTQGTGMAARISPDGRLVAFDAVGVLWVMPAEGGAAHRLTDDLGDVALPDWAPDSATLVFQSYRDGVFNLWTIRADGTGLRQLTHGPYDHREPRFSPDGKKIACSSDAENGSYGIHLLEVASGTSSVLTRTGEQECEPAWSPDGTKVAIVVGYSRVDVVTIADGSRTTVVRAPAGHTLHAPSWTPDGADLVFQRQLPNGDTQLVRAGKPLFAGEEVFPFPVSWAGPREYVYTADGVIRRRSLDRTTVRDIAFTATVTVTRPRYRKRRRDFDSVRPHPVIGIGSPVLSPDGTRIAFRALNDVYTMRIGSAPRPLTGDHWWKCDPAWSPDGKYLSYSTDRGGKLDLWLRDLATGEDRQLTHLPGAAAVSGSWSPDSARLAFLNQDGALHVVEVATGAVRKVYPATFEPGRPSWSADGRVIAMAAIKPYSARFREGLSKILLVDVATGEGRYADPIPDRSIQTRGDDGPVFSPDGRRMAFAMASVLWVLDVHADGTPAGVPRRITDELTDAPSWSGDSRELLYLSGGRLRIVPAEGGTPRTVPVRLSWTNVRPRGRTLIRAGAMWDGESHTLRRNVDVLVEGHRIAAVEPRRDSWDAELVDARDAVVLPGLIDMHHHREMQGYEYGDRQGRLWLSLGFTTTRSPGSPAYHMVEARESVQSGARVAPRYFGTGEAIDGARVFYNFMRPTFDERQLERELERAEALDYDLMKAYVRLPPEWQRRVVRWAHEHGVPATSHYSYPALGFGGDGMEHMGATSRFGYSRTISALGKGYRDDVALFAASGAARTPTLFRNIVLYAEDTSLVEDRRVRTLYPAWEYAKLRDTVTRVRNTDLTADRRNLAHQVQQVAALIRAGGLVVTGTDSPIDHTAVSTHMNLRAMVRHGLTPHEALVTATSAPGRFLGEPLGRIAPGMFADLIVVGGDPLRDIRHAADVRTVVSNGLVYTVDDLLAPFTTARASLAPTPVAATPEHPANREFWWHDPHYVAASRHSCCAGD